MFHEERETAAAAKDASTAGTSPTVELKHAQQKASNVKTAANGTISLKCVSPDKGKVYTLEKNESDRGSDNKLFVDALTQGKDSKHMNQVFADMQVGPNKNSQFQSRHWVFS